MRPERFSGLAVLGCGLTGQPTVYHIHSSTQVFQSSTVFINGE